MTEAMLESDKARIAFLVASVFMGACNDNALPEIDGPWSAPGAGTGGGAAGSPLGAGATAGAGSPEVGGAGAGGSAESAAGMGGSSAVAGSGGTAGAGGAIAAAGAAGWPASLDPGSAGDGERELGPDYDDAPELGERSDVPRGKLIEFKMKSSESAIYPGNAPKTGAYERTVWVHIPAQYVSGTPAPTIVVQDGGGFSFKDILTRSLENMIADGDLPVIVSVFANSGGGDYLQSQRGVEYDTVSGRYAEWVDTELLPRAEQETLKQRPEQAVKFTENPEGRAAMGGSSGGAAAFSMAWWRPDLFRRVITFSGTYVDQEWPEVSERPFGAWHYHEDGDMDDGGLIANEAGTKPIRIWFASAANDLGAGGPASTHRNFDLANQRMAVKLKAKGYHYHYDHALNAGHVDRKVTAQTLPEALRWLWRGFVPEVSP